MEQVALLGPASSSWYNGRKSCFYWHPGIACLEVLQQEGLYEKLDELGAMLEKGILEQAAKHNIDITLNRLKGAFNCILHNKYN